MNSYLEASHAGKPIIGIPIFADQFYNLACAIRKGFALYVDKTNLTTEAIRYAVNEALTNPVYSQKAKEIAAMLKGRPLSAKDELIQSVEYSAKNPRLFDVLQLESADMSLFEYYCIDVLLFLLLVSVSIVAITVCFLKFVLTRQVKLKRV